MLLKNFLEEKVFVLQVAIVLTCFPSEKSQTKLDLMQSFLLKRFTKLVTINLRGSTAKKVTPQSFSILILPESAPKHYFASCQDFPHQNF